MELSFHGLNTLDFKILATLQNLNFFKISQISSIHSIFLLFSDFK